MAEGASYPVRLVNANEQTTEGTTLVFTDSSDQPEPPGGGGGPANPYAPTTGNDVTVLTDSTGAHALISGGDDAGGVNVFSINGAKSVSVSNSGTAVTGALSSSAEVGATDFAPTGLTGAVSATRYVGGTADVAPTTGTFIAGDWVVSLTGKVWVCTVGGTSGTWVQANSATFAPLASPTFTGTVTVPAAAAVNAAPRLSQLSSALTITSGTLPNTGSWVSGTAKQNPVTRQITVAVECVFDGTANAATVGIGISPDNVTYTTIGTPGVSAAINTVGGLTVLTNVSLPAAWYIKLTIAAHASVAASIYY